MVIQYKNTLQINTDKIQIFHYKIICIKEKNHRSISPSNVSSTRIQHSNQVCHNCRGGSRMVGALKQTTWWGPFVLLRKKNLA